MYTLQTLVICLLLLIARISCGSLCVTKIIVRVPREHDIGLIFDLSVSNKNTADRKETLDFYVNSDGNCVFNTSKGEQVSANRIFGGNFGSIQPGKSTTISLILPTVSLYNRLGYCPVIISASNSRKETANTKQLLYFDTRFETLDPNNHTLRKRKNFMNCDNWDKDNFKNCTPVNCEERYFGQRSFYNSKTESCEPVPPCSAPNTIYDMFANECIEKDNFISEEELEQIKQGAYDNNFLKLHSGADESDCTPRGRLKQGKQKKSSDGIGRPNCQFNGKLSLIEFRNCFQDSKDNLNTFPSIKSDSYLAKDHGVRSILNQFYYASYMPLKRYRKSNDNEDDDDDEGESEDTPNENMGDERASVFGYINEKFEGVGWLFKIIATVFTVVVSLLAYLCICLIVYAMVEYTARKKPYKTSGVHITKQLTPRNVDATELSTKSSIMLSHRI